ncbi:MAG: methylated-DNA--[protein]-cysteine S-methyltransferase [Hyphomicrobiaceae bacterium]
MRLGRIEFKSPIGALQVYCSDVAVVGLLFVERDRTSIERHFGSFQVEPVEEALGVRRALERYFGGDIHALEDLPAEGLGTPFQREVWAALRNIRPGETTTYGALAKMLGRDGAQRAVGAANGANPIGIIVPCHRVIGSANKLTGYGGGLDRKHWLLKHEGALLC